MRPIGGVIHNLSATWLLEDIMYNSVDLGYYDWESNHDPDTEEWDVDTQGDVLIGFIECDKKDAWFGVEGERASYYWKPDKSAEYSAIVGEVNSQIAWSQWNISARLCSPCYPNQADLDSVDPDNGMLAFSLPPDLFDKEEDDYPVDQIQAIAPEDLVTYANELGI